MSSYMQVFLQECTLGDPPLRGAAGTVLGVPWWWYTHHWRGTPSLARAPCGHTGVGRSWKPRKETRRGERGEKTEQGRRSNSSPWRDWNETTTSPSNSPRRVLPSSTKMGRMLMF